MNCPFCKKDFDPPPTGARNNCTHCGCNLASYTFYEYSHSDIMHRLFTLESKLDELLKERNERLDTSRH